MANEGLTMPHNTDAESSLLGCLIIDNELDSQLVETLTEDDFYVEAHKYIIKGMKKVFSSRKPVDIVTLSDELERSGDLERAGGIAYITELAQAMPSTANYKYYLDIVRRESMNRKLIRAGRNIIENSMKDGEVQESVEFAERQVFDISRQTDNSALKGMPEEDIVQKVMSDFEAIQNDPTMLRGVETGFRLLDKLTNGLQKSDLIILAARPGMGKTSFAMNIVEHAALQKGKVCAVFSLEMPRDQIVRRLLCAYANVSMAKAMSGKLEAKDWKKLFSASDRLSKSKIYIDDTSRIMPAQITSKCRRLAAQEGRLDLVMIDYIQLMGSISGSGSGELNRQNEVAMISRDLKLMAKELNVPVIALSQLRRIQTQEPTLSDLRESGAIEQDADIVMFINRPDANAKPKEGEEQKPKDAADLIIAKHRNGSQGRIPLRFIGECTKFIDVDAQNRDDEPPEYAKADNYSDYESNAQTPEPGEGDLPPIDENSPQNIPPISKEEFPF